MQFLSVGALGGLGSLVPHVRGRVSVGHPLTWSDKSEIFYQPCHFVTVPIILNKMYQDFINFWNVLVSF